MYIKKNYSLTETAFFNSGKHLTWLVPYTLLIAALYRYTALHQFSIPWLPLSLIGTAVTFYVGFKNNQAYWDGLVETDSEKSYLPLPMTEKKLVDGQPVTRRKYTPAFKAECVRQVAAGARPSDVARAQGLSPALLGRWQRNALEQAVPSSAEREE